MRLLQLLDAWPVARQIRTGDLLGRGRAAQSAASAARRPRTEDADRVVQSICPYCAVGCGQRIHVRDEQVLRVEGDPDSPISRGKLCPKGAATRTMLDSPLRETRVRYRPPHATDWQDLDLDVAMDMIAERVIATRARTWQDRDDDGVPLNRTLGLAHLGGATLDNEENYLLKKLYTAIGAIQVENQARI